MKGKIKKNCGKHFLVNQYFADTIQEMIYESGCLSSIRGKKVMINVKTRSRQSALQKCKYSTGNIQLWNLATKKLLQGTQVKY